MTTARALLSVFDKAGLLPFARDLRDLGFELVSSGGTADALAAAGIEHRRVEDVTGFPEMLDGRVKTMHPRIHAAILADRSNPEHMAVIAEHEITPIDLVVCNLYPFTSNPSIELIDVGGPSMVRAAAKNWAHVGVVVNPGRYGPVVEELRSRGHLSDDTRKSLARDAFAHTAAYDAAIATWFDQPVAPADPAPFPKSIHLSLDLASVLRYGENPHQSGARYRFTGSKSWWDGAVQHGGKEMSYLNVYDTDAAWRLVHDLGDTPAVAIIKHANPCGAAVAADLVTAYELAHRCDPVSAFGGIVALNRRVDLATAEKLAPVFTEVVVAPGFDADALVVLTARKNVRVIEADAPTGDRFEFRSVDGGVLVQDPDDVAVDVAESGNWKVVTQVAPTNAQWRDLRFAWIVSAHVKSNAIVIANGEQAVGVGAGQQSRVDAAEIAIRKAGHRATGGVCASDAFFPFRDGVDMLAEAGVRAIVQPGGSMRDDEVSAACNEHGIAMVFTDHRHFRH